MRRMKARINQDGEDALKELSRRAEPFIDWQMSKSTGHCFTEEGKGCIKFHSCHDDQWYGPNGQLHLLYITRCDEDELPHLPNLANCKGTGYHFGWANEGTQAKSAAKGQSYSA